MRQAALARAYLNNASSAHPDQHVPDPVFSGDVFFFFNVSISLSWAEITLIFSPDKAFVLRRDRFPQTDRLSLPRLVQLQQHPRGAFLGFEAFFQ